MAGACGYPLQETFIKTFCFYYFALLTLGYNSNVHHDVSEKSQQVLDGYTSRLCCHKTSKACQGQYAPGLQS